MLPVQAANGFPHPLAASIIDIKGFKN